MKHKFPSTLAAAAVALASQSAGAAPILDFQGNTLVGATGVDVNGNLYDVSFSGGTCTRLFGCADGSSFVISAGDANAAGAAIAQLGFGPLVNNGGSGLRIIAGCSNAFTRCDILTPFAVANGTVQVEDLALTIDPPIGLVETLQATTIGSGVRTNPETTFAIFTAEAAPASVPEPASTALVAIGLAAAAASVRRRQGD